MDPNATCDLIIAALNKGYFYEADEAAENLLGWLSRGGFAPSAANLRAIAEIVSDSGEPVEEYVSLYALTCKAE